MRGFRTPKGLIGAGIVILVLAIALLAPLFISYQPPVSLTRT